MEWVTMVWIPVPVQPGLTVGERIKVLLTKPVTTSRRSNGGSFSGTAGGRSE